MKILVLSYHRPDSPEQHASFSIRYLTAIQFAERGHDVIFMFPGRKSLLPTGSRTPQSFLPLATPDVFPKRLQKGGFCFVDAVYKAIVALKYHFDVIYVLNGHRPAHFLPSILAKLFTKSIIVDECWEWHGMGGYADKRTGLLGKMLSAYDSVFEVPLKRFYDHIIAITSTLKHRFKKNKNITVLHGGSDTSALVCYSISEARRTLQIDPNLFLLGMSNVTKTDHCDNHIFFKAFSLLITRYPNLFLMVTGHDAHYIDYVSRKYSLGNRVIFFLWPEFHKYNLCLSSCDVFVLPYPKNVINEARWPNRFSDYLCLDKPIITNTTGDVAPLFVKYSLGTLCPYTTDGFTQAVSNLIENGHRLKAYCKDSHYVANKILSFDARIEKLLEVFSNESKTPRGRHLRS